MCPKNNPCMHVLTLEGDKLHSLITCGGKTDAEFPFFFFLDPLKNFVLGDADSHTIRVFSPGNLLHTIGREGHQPRMFFFSAGIAITCMFYTTFNQLEFRVEMFPKSVSNDETGRCWLLRPLVSARIQTGSSFISELTCVCSETNF